jgi:hypothetical protein
MGRTLRSNAGSRLAMACGPLVLRLFAAREVFRLRTPCGRNMDFRVVRWSWGFEERWITLAVAYHEELARTWAEKPSVRVSVLVK